jgi:hypothetical protein
MKGQCHNDAEVVINTLGLVAKEVAGGILRLESVNARRTQ